VRVRVVPIGGTTTDFLLDGIEIAEEMESGTVTSYVGPGLISQISGTTRTIYHADGLGSTRAMSDSSQVVTESSTYDAYGNAVAAYGTAPNFGYVGQYRYYTDATGLHYLKARYYDPVAGRFLSRDPIGYRGSSNLYAYVSGNPVSDVDPSGLISLGGIGSWVPGIGFGWRDLWNAYYDYYVWEPIRNEDQDTINCIDNCLAEQSLFRCTDAKIGGGIWIGTGIPMPKLPGTPIFGGGSRWGLPVRYIPGIGRSIGDFWKWTYGKLPSSRIIGSGTQVIRGGVLIIGGWEAGNWARCLGRCL